MEKNRSLCFRCGYVNPINIWLIALHFYVNCAFSKYYKDDKIEFPRGQFCPELIW